MKPAWTKPERTRWRFPRFICIVGIDGSGKTTLARAIVARAKREGIDCHYVWANAQPILMLPLRWIARHTLLRDKNMFDDYSSYQGAKKSIVGQRSPMRAIYSSVLIVDYSIWLALRICIPLFMGRRIVCDRYVHDVAINAALLADGSPHTVRRWASGLLRIFPSPEWLFHVDVPEEIAIARKSDIPSIEYLRQRRSLYQQLLQNNASVPLDGTLSPSELVTSIWSTIQGGEN